eukprot:9281272-Alexandrium_andersonii.AAC.1
MPARRQWSSMGSHAAAWAASLIAAWARPAAHGVGGSTMPRLTSSCRVTDCATGTAMLLPRSWKPVLSRSGHESWANS